MFVEQPPAVPPNAEEVRAAMQPPPRIDTLCATFGLSSFERKILLMCAAVELDSQFSSLYSAANKDPRPSFPNFSLALAAFEDAHWSALLPTHPLRFWRLVEVVTGDTLTTSPLRIDERILHYLAGAPSIDERLRGLTEPLDTNSELPELQCAVAEQVAGTWPRIDPQTLWPVVHLRGGDLPSKRQVAALACARLGLHLRVLPAPAAPRGVADIDLFIRLWEREAALNPSGLLLEYDEADSLDAPGEAALKRLVETLRSPLLISARERHKPVERRLLSFEVPAATSAEQLSVWKEALGAAAVALDGRVETLVAQFSLSPAGIHAAVTQALQPADSAAGAPGGVAPLGRDAVSASADQLATNLWDACRMQARPRLEGLAQRIEPAATWDDLVLPEMQKQLLRQIVVHVRERTKVYQTWGFAAKGSRGLGISALFAGPSGTGKTMAGEVLANALRLDLYRIDLSQVVSKYIGETEKNLRRVFDAAEGGAAILLFDEADALFGKRSEVKDSHDRYANIEVGYLLQRMETYRGLAILTTNRKEALDFAFLRRIRFVAEFPFPEAAQRAEIWRRVFPRQTPTEGLRVDRLARLSAAGGNIQNIAMGAAFLAADAGEPVRMSHLLSAARSEFTKIERPLTDAETAGWV
jgi:ATP-dependent 26S proteasome regulatory subunit